MRRARRCGARTATRVLAFVLCASTVAKAARAAVQVAYRAPTECPTQTDFVSAVSARVSQLALRDDASNRMLSVSAVSTEAGYAGTLRIFVEGNLSFERQLIDRHCAALMEALALVAAMELNPPDTGAPNVSRTRAAQNNKHRPGETQTVSSMLQPSPLSWRLSAVVGVQTAQSPAPLLAVGISAAALRERESQFVSLSLLYGQSGFHRYVTAEARFSWMSARVVGCPLGLTRASVAVHPCAIAELGVLRGEARAVSEPTNRYGVWLAPGLALHGSSSAGRIAIEGLVGVIRPIVRDRFTLAGPTPSDPSQTVHRADSIGLVGELRVGWTF